MQPRSKYTNYYYYYHYHYHHHIARRVLGLVTCSGPTNSREVFRGVVLGFVSHTADISELSVAGSLSVSVHSPNTLYIFISVILNFSLLRVNFKFQSNIINGFVFPPCAFCRSPHKCQYRLRYPGLILFSNCPSFASVQ
jgi:hypothetical protein